MGKQVPLVVYKGGVRTVVGHASVEKDGMITAQVARDHWKIVKDFLVPDKAEITIAPIHVVKIHPDAPKI